MADPRETIDVLRDRIETSDDLSDTDREALLAFSDQLFLLKSEYSDYRHEKLLRHCTIMGEEVGDIAAAREDRAQAETIVRWINSTYDNEETNRDYRLALRAFGKRTVGDGEVPDALDWVPSSTSSTYDPAPEPSQMLHWEADIVPMLEACSNPRDRAIIAVAWDAGCRSGEFRDLDVGDVTDHRHGLQITVQGKNGQRTVTLIPSVPYLQQWLTEHPSGAATDPLWSKLSAAEAMSYNNFTKILRRAADRADVNKPVTLTNFRKSSASYLASKGVNQATLEDHHGWSRGSDAASRYIAVFGDAADDALAEAHGLEIEREDETDEKAVTCPRCDKQTPSHEEFCVWCGQATDPGAADTMREREEDLRTAVMRLIRDDPAVLDTVENAQDLLTVLDERPELADDAKRFRDALQEFES
ncbi:tyrosine-type recombinase/integrase [Haloglomus litoreum]|uniref:tyrosine-type recombinase/integrase n=1 Tax=Haloglomus litoreum TaxID=3034026 RepID=UPI0023E8A7D9|nr:site-specific integrase [Haloglomus sp. DT116]